VLQVVGSAGCGLIELDLLGGAPNLGGDHISFRQQGVLPRGKIVPLLADALRKMDKLVVIEEI